MKRRGVLGIAVRTSAVAALLAAVVAGCGDDKLDAEATAAGAGGGTSAGGGDAGPKGKTIDLGKGFSATLSDDGSLSVEHVGTSAVATPAGASIFGVVRDAASPAAWHDPAGSASWKGVAAHDVTMTNPAPGQLHLHLADQGKDAVLVSLALAMDDGVYTGLGERYDHVDAKGAMVPLYMAAGGPLEGGTNEVHVPVPFVVDSNGWGLFVESREAGAFDLGKTHAGTMRAAFEGTALDVDLFFSDTNDPLEVVGAYTLQTGAPRHPPLWSLAPMHWRNEWPDAATVLTDADAYRSMHIPASCIWFDNPWETSYNTAVLDPARFGDTAALMTALADKGFRTLAWSTPYLEQPTGTPTDDAQVLYQQAESSGYFVEQQGGTPFPALGCCFAGLGMVDFTNAAATDFWKGILKNATDTGFAGFKLDYGEDLVTQLLGVRLAITLSDGETARTGGRTYATRYHAAYHAALDLARPDGFILGRASTYGGQTIVDAIWPGDLDSGFEHRGDGGDKVGGLPAAVVAAQTLATSGFPAFGSDTGGFKGDPTRESLLRWAEHTAFSVIMQLGGGGNDHNPWLIDAQAGDIYAGLARQHMRLVPYLDGLLATAHDTGRPTIIPLPLAYPLDVPARAHADDEYLLGPDLLVAPVLEAGATSRVVHLPYGAWIDWFDGTMFTGPTDVTVPAVLGTPPVFARGGALVPLYPDGIDTLVDATDPGVVTLASVASSVEARAFALGITKTTFPEGSTLALGEDTAVLTLTFAPVAPVNEIVVTVDLRVSDFGLAPSLAVTTTSGTTPVPVVDEAAVRASLDSAYATSATGDTLWVKLVGAAVVRASHQ